jgi:DNA-binding transcriptional LysR family regulator
MLGRAEQRRLRIGVPPYGGKIPARNQITRRFAAENPDVALELEVGWTPRLLERVVSGDLDGAFGIGWLEPLLRRREICRLQVKLRVAPHDPLANQEAVFTKALKGRRVAVFTRGLYPELYDAVFAGPAWQGVNLVQTPEFHDRMIQEDAGSPPLIAAEFRVQGRPGGEGPWLADSPEIPFSLFAPAGPLGPDIEALWSAAQAVGG